MKLLYKVGELSNKCLVFDTDNYRMSYETFENTKEYSKLDTRPYFKSGYVYTDSRKCISIQDKFRTSIIYNNYFLCVDLSDDFVYLNNTAIDAETMNIFYLSLWYEFKGVSVLEYYPNFIVTLTRDGSISVNSEFVMKAEYCPITQFRRRLLL